jgi:translation elongation factor EF-G
MGGGRLHTGVHSACRRNLCLRFVQLAEVDEEIGELFLMEQPVDGPTLQAAVRRATLALQFVPVFVGSAYKNKAGRHILLNLRVVSQLHRVTILVLNLNSGPMW